MLAKLIIFPLIVAAIIAHIVKGNQPSPQPAPKPVPTEAEIDAALEQMAAERGAINLNWRESIVDLLDLLQIENTMETRGKLYGDLGGIGDYIGSAEQNVWMIREVRRRFAEGRLD